MWGVGCGVYDVRSRVWGLGWRVQGEGLRMWDSKPEEREGGVDQRAELVEVASCSSTTVED